MSQKESGNSVKSPRSNLMTSRAVVVFMLASSSFVKDKQKKWINVVIEFPSFVPLKPRCKAEFYHSKNDLFTLWNMPAGNHGNCIHQNKYPVHDDVYNYYDSPAGESHRTN